MAALPDGDIGFYLPPEQEAGTYANAFSVWHTPYDFSIDFAASQYPQLSDLDDPASPPIVPARIVARVRIPPTLAFDLIQAINVDMADYEATWGEIARPERREENE